MLASLGLASMGLSGGCKKDVPTSLLLTITRAGGVPRPATIFVRILDRKGEIANHTYPDGGRSLGLPATVYFDLDPMSVEVAVIAVGASDADAGATDDSGGYTAFLKIESGKQIEATLQLGQPFRDRDGDRIPDDIDNCPDRINADQRSADGKVGNVCRPDAGADVPVSDGGGDAKPADGGDGKPADGGDAVPADAGADASGDAKSGG